MKIVINADRGGFCLGKTAYEMLLRLNNKFALDNPPNEAAVRFNDYCMNIPRTDPDLITVVEILGAEAGGDSASLKVVVIPDNIEWQINEHAGVEWVAEKHRTWY